MLHGIATNFNRKNESHSFVESDVSSAALQVQSFDVLPVDDSATEACSDDINLTEVDSDDDDLKTVGSLSPVHLEECDRFVEEDWELEVLRESPFYCEGDELDDSLTGPYKVLAEQHKETFRVKPVEYICNPSITHIPSEPKVKIWDRKFVSPSNRSYIVPHQFDDA